MQLIKNISQSIKKFIKACSAYLPLQNIILLESVPDYADNTYPVYLELCRRKEFDKYRLVWAVRKDVPCPDFHTEISKRTSFVKRNSLLFKWYQLRAKVQLSCNSYLRKKDSRQISIFLTHGSPAKKTRGIYEMGTAVGFINVQSHFFDEIITYECNCTSSQLVYLGFPRCDWFYCTDMNETKKKMGLTSQEPFFIWLPTFRQHNNKHRTDAENHSFKYFGMSLIYSDTDLAYLNDFLKERKAHIFLKPHPVQDISELTAKSLSHIHIIYERDLVAYQLQLYQVLAASSALITDYSSVFFDYLLLDRPVATTVDDLEQWKKGRGFPFDLESIHEQSTVRVHDVRELCDFIDGVLAGQDEKRTRRNMIKELTNTYRDGNSAKRIADFLAEQLNIQK